MGMVLGNPALAQKEGGILRVFHRDSPASVSILEEGSISAIMPMMGVFNNLVLFNQHVPQNDVAAQYSHRSPARSALNAGNRLRPVCLLDVSDRHADQSDRLLGAVRASGGPGPGADLLLSAGQYDRARHVAAGQDDERCRSLQPDPRSRRRNRPGYDRDDYERAAAFSLEPVDRGHQPGPRFGATVPRFAGQPF